MCIPYDKTFPLVPTFFVPPAKHSSIWGSLCPASSCLSGSHAFLVVTHSFVSQATHASLGMLPLCFGLVTLTLKFGQLKKHFNLGHIFLTLSGRDFICTFLVTIPFHGYQKFWLSDLDLVVWPTNVLKKNLNLSHSFLTRRGRAFILHTVCTFFITRPFHGYQHFWPSDLDLEVWPTFKKL